MTKAAKKISRTDRQAAYDAYERLEHVVKLMCKNHIGEGWKPNLDEANHALAYFKGLAAGQAYDLIDENRAMIFLSRHGISADYIILGNLDALLCRSIANSTAAKSIENDKAAKALAEAESIVSDMETPIIASANLARALRAISSSDDVPSEPGGAIEAVADHLVEQLEGIVDQRERAWKLLREGFVAGCNKTPGRREAA